MQNQEKNQFEQEETQLAISLKLYLLSGILGTVADIIATYAAKFAIDEVMEEQAFEQQENAEQETRLKELERQVEALQRKLEELQL